MKKAKGRGPENGPAVVVDGVQVSLTKHGLFIRVPVKVLAYTLPHTEDGYAIPQALTPQQEKIFELTRSGLSRKEIAAKLNVSLRTVQYYLSVLYSKLHVEDRTDLFRVYGVVPRPLRALTK